MQIRNDRRTPAPIVKDIYDIPIVEKYKYLGVTLDDSLNLKPEL